MREKRKKPWIQPVFEEEIIYNDQLSCYSDNFDSTTCHSKKTSGVYKVDTIENQNDCCCVNNMCSKVVEGIFLCLLSPALLLMFCANCFNCDDGSSSFSQIINKAVRFIKKNRFLINTVLIMVITMLGPLFYSVFGNGTQQGYLFFLIFVSVMIFHEVYYLWKYLVLIVDGIKENDTTITYSVIILFPVRLCFLLSLCYFYLWTIDDQRFWSNVGTWGDSYGIRVWLRLLVTVFTNNGVGFTYYIPIDNVSKVFSWLGSFLLWFCGPVLGLGIGFTYELQRTSNNNSSEPDSDTDEEENNNYSTSPHHKSSNRYRTSSCGLGKKRKSVRNWLYDLFIDIRGTLSVVCVSLIITIVVMALQDVIGYERVIGKLFFTFWVVVLVAIWVLNTTVLFYVILNRSRKDDQFISYFLIVLQVIFFIITVSNVYTLTWVYRENQDWIGVQSWASNGVIFNVFLNFVLLAGYAKGEGVLEVVPLGFLIEIVYIINVYMFYLYSIVLPFAWAAALENNKSKNTSASSQRSNKYQ